MQTINVVDTTPPDLLLPDDIVVECDAEIVYEDASAVDNCSEVTISVYEQIFYGSNDNNYTIYREFNATDESGNTSVGVQLIEVVDSTSPSAFNIPDDIIGNCNDIPDSTLEPLFIDNCAEVTVEYSESQILGSCLGNYEIIRSWTATDASNNVTVVTQSVIVSDNDAPVFEPLADIEISCSSDLNLPVPTLLTGCSEEVLTIEQEIIFGDCPNSYDIVRTFTATDACGNSSDFVHTTSIYDDLQPVFTFVPADYTAECSEEHPMESTTATDNCGEVVITVEEITNAGACAGDYVITRTFTATDDCGNATSATQTITIIDTTAPEFTYSS